jgi:hypothetical protein
MRNRNRERGVSCFGISLDNAGGIAADGSDSHRCVDPGGKSPVPIEILNISSASENVPA